MWIVSTNQLRSLAFSSVTIQNVGLSVIGSYYTLPNHSNITKWAGNATGSFTISSGVTASASIAFDTISGIGSLHATANYTSTYVDISVSLDYVADPNCTNTLYLFSESLSDYNPAAFVGQVFKLFVSCIVIANAMIGWHVQSYLEKSGNFTRHSCRNSCS